MYMVVLLDAWCIYFLQFLFSISATDQSSFWSLRWSLRCEFAEIMWYTHCRCVDFYSLAHAFSGVVNFPMLLQYLVIEWPYICYGGFAVSTLDLYPFQPTKKWVPFYSESPKIHSTENFFMSSPSLLTFLLFHSSFLVCRLCSLICSGVSLLSFLSLTSRFLDLHGLSTSNFSFSSAIGWLSLLSESYRMRCVTFYWDAWWFLLKIAFSPDIAFRYLPALAFVWLGRAGVAWSIDIFFGTPFLSMDSVCYLTLVMRIGPCALDINFLCEDLVLFSELISFSACGGLPTDIHFWIWKPGICVLFKVLVLSLLLRRGPPVSIFPLMRVTLDRRWVHNMRGDILPDDSDDIAYWK